MKASYDRSLSLLLAHEGGYSNHPDDPGGPTNFGITIADARKYAAEFGWITDRQVDAFDVKAMPRWFAEKVYRAKYWDAQRCDDLPAGVDYAVFDYGVNSGIGRSGKVLRRVLGISDATSAVTDEVIATARSDNPKTIVAAICDERLRFLKSLKTWPVFGNGWGRRVADVRAAALAMTDNVAVAPPAPAPAPGKAVPPPAPTIPAKHAASGGSIVAAVIAALQAHTLEMAIGIVALGIVAALAIHFLWPKKG